MTTQTIYDVAVVGFGPSGAVAAALLGQAGLSVHVCDRQREVYDKPRAVSLDHEIMRVFQQLGLVEAIAPFVEPFTPSEYFGVDGKLFRRMTMIAPPYPQGYTPSMVFTQPPVERVLREHVSAMPNVAVQLGVALQQMEQHEDHVALTLAHEDGSLHEVHARYVVGCDGATSTVRALTGMALEDLGFDEPWLVADVLVNAQGLAKLPATSVQYCEPERPCSLVIGPKNHRRWEISLKASEDPREAATPEGTWKLLSRWITPADGELWRQASYRFHALVAKNWRQGRVFIAGDAAHQQPPFLGQGMCQGIRDAANVSWKLVAVLRGEVKGHKAEALLDSYGQERQAHVRELTSRIKHIGELIGERDTFRARARDARALADCNGVVRDTPRQDVLPGLTAGLLSAHASSAKGSLFPQPRISEAGAAPVLMDQRFGNGWRLVLDTQLAATPGEGLTTIQLNEARLTESDGVVAAWMQRHGCHGALVRPDNYVFGVAATQSELDALLAEHAAVTAA